MLEKLYREALRDINLPIVVYALMWLGVATFALGFLAAKTLG